MTPKNYDGYSREELLRLLQEREAEDARGLRLAYKGQAPPWRIVRQIQPRRQRLEPKLSCGSEEEQSRNLLMEGENLQAMVSLYKYRGQVDLILTDPPYNTGEDFRYNDRWDEDPNDPDLGTIVPAEDGSRHSKWLRFMVPRLWMMREMLAPSGVLAICIDHRELYRLGMVLDDIFGEQNRIGIINWQKSAAARPDNTHVSTSTEYVLIYGKDIARVKTASLERREEDNTRYDNWDNDPLGDWREGNLTARSYSAKDDYGIQSPFTGIVHYPAGNGAWRHPKRNIQAWLNGWDVEYEERDIADGRANALMVKDQRVGAVTTAVSTRAFARLKQNNWPFVWFGRKGDGRPRVKTHLDLIKKGKVPVTYWSDLNFGTEIEEDIELGTNTELGSMSWNYLESGRSADGVHELTAVVGSGHGFSTVKPMKLMTKIIQLWCKPNGIVMDPFAGSGTTGHAVLELNKESGATRRFILIEQGRPERGDPYARTLTYERLKNAITGVRFGKNKAAQNVTPLEGGFRFSKLTFKVDPAAVLALEREEMLDLLLTTHWDFRERASSHLRRLAAGEHKYLFAVSARNEGFFLVWNGPDKPSILGRDEFKSIAEEAKTAGLSAPYHVYARQLAYSGPRIEFYQIPDRILEKIGFNETTQPYSTESLVDRREKEQEGALV